MTNAKKQEILDALPDPTPGVRGVRREIEKLNTELRSNEKLTTVGMDRLSVHVAMKIPLVSRTTSYNPGFTGRRSTYGNSWIVFREDLESAHEQAQELKLKHWGQKAFCRTLAPKKRATYAYTGRRWKRLCIYHLMRDDDFGQIWRERNCSYRYAAIRAYRARSSDTGESLWLVKGPGWTHHLPRRKEDHPKAKIREALRSERRKRESDRKNTEFLLGASHKWVTVDSSLRSGNCEPGTMSWVRAHNLEGVGAIRGDLLLELEDSPRTRRVLANAAA